MKKPRREKAERPKRQIIEDARGDFWYLDPDWQTDGKVFWNEEEESWGSSATWDEAIECGAIEPCDPAKYERQLTEEKVISHVQVNARFVEDAPEHAQYVVRYPNSVMGKLYSSDDPRGLVLKIMEDCHPRAKVSE